MISMASRSCEGNVGNATEYPDAEVGWGIRGGTRQVQSPGGIAGACIQALELVRGRIQSSPKSDAIKLSSVKAPSALSVHSKRYFKLCYAAKMKSARPQAKRLVLHCEICRTFVICRMIPGGGSCQPSWKKVSSFATSRPLHVLSNHSRVFECWITHAFLVLDGEF